MIAAARAESAAYRDPRWSKLLAQLDARGWRTQRRAAGLAPLSTKVRHRGARVDVVPLPKKRGSGK